MPPVPPVPPPAAVERGGPLQGGQALPRPAAGRGTYGRESAPAQRRRRLPPAPRSRPACPAWPSSLCACASWLGSRWMMTDNSAAMSSEVSASKGIEEAQDSDLQCDRGSAGGVSVGFQLHAVQGLGEMAVVCMRSARQPMG
eukprot:CAMPEP_0174699848 /NCGR_PEP_ID=MMETSP1094-20130205/4999_1 /TAXON_ID=156173 /ORGANISM="Chrysochromulina brevifilum, Strain UTEX LB 985" /LENGTH=141 /DNA_ID=CAMNT_0015897253 /DNA_START=127 /DNA_END=553 /DNA_ORIENTATION=-